MSAAWEAYLAAAQRLDAVRQEAATVAGEQARAAQAARHELTSVRARLTAQQNRLRALGVPETELMPSPREVAAAAEAMAGGPAAVLVALRGSRVLADTADVRLIGLGVPAPLAPVFGQLFGPTFARSGWLRHLLLFGLVGLPLLTGLGMLACVIWIFTAW